MEDDPTIRKLQNQIAAQPNILSLRLKLGIALIERKRWREALPEIQKARQDELFRAQAMQLQKLIYTELDLRE